MLAVPAQGAQIRPAILPLSTSDIVKNIALKCLKELAVSLALNLTVACFVFTTAGLVLMVSATVVQFVANIFFHSLGAYAHIHGHKKTAEICEWITGANFAFFIGHNAQTLIHETGHALAAMALYKRAYPQIEIYPFSKGLTQFFKSTLGPLGKKIGPVATTCAVIASGPAFTLLVSSVIFASGLARKHTQLGKHMIAWGALDFVNHAQYAYSATYADPWNLSHDFVHLSVFGLHPVAAAVGILAIPVLITLWQKNEPPRRAAHT